MLIISYITFLLNPLFSSIFIILGIIKDRVNNKHYSLLFAGVLACIAYWVTPKSDIDLSYYLQTIAMLHEMNWTMFYETILSQDLLFITNVLFYLISRTGNPHLLPSFVIFISYFIILYIITDYAKRNNISSSQMIFTIVFVLSVLPYISLVSNVRNILAFSIFSLGVYRELLQNKKGVFTYSLYVIPIFIHISAIALVFVRLFVKLSSKKSWINIAFVIFATVVFFWSISLVGFISNIPLIGEYLSAFVIKANNYINNTGSDYAVLLQESAFYKLQKLYLTLVVGLLLFLMYIVPKKNSDETKFELFFKYICLIVLLCYPIVLTVYFRFTIVALILGFICILGRLNYIKLSEWRLIIYSMLLLISLVGILHQFYYFNRLAYLDDVIYEFGVRSLFNMFFR